MNKHVRFVVAALAGAIGIHIAFAACDSGGGSGPGGAGGGADGPVGTSSGPGGGGLVDAILDALGARDARADTDSGAPAPQGAIKTADTDLSRLFRLSVPRDAASPVLSFDGPMVITGVNNPGSGGNYSSAKMVSWIAPIAAPCGNITGFPTAGNDLPGPIAISQGYVASSSSSQFAKSDSLPFFVNSDEKLCVKNMTDTSSGYLGPNANTFGLTGYRPY